jgi:hypothetical protein
MVDLARTLRAGNIFCLFQIGDMPGDKVRNSTRLFAEKVMPHLRDMWPEHRSDGRFWCKPLARRAVPAPVGDMVAAQ